MEMKKHYLFIVLYLTTAFLIRWLYLSEYSCSPLFSISVGADVQEYSQWARQILAGRLLWSRVEIHAPLYPYFLALLYWCFSFNMYFVRGFQLLLGFLAILPIAGSVLILRGDNTKNSYFLREMILFSLVWAWYPPLIYYQAELISESLLLPLISLAIFFLYMGEKVSAMKLGREFLYFAAAGFFCGLAILAHPLSFFFTAFETIYLFIRNQNGYRLRWGAAASPIIFISAALLTIAPSGIYNAVFLKEFVPVQANSGFNLYLGNNPDADGTCYLRPGPEWDRVHHEADKAAKELGVSKDRYFANRTVQFAISNPIKCLKLLFMKAVYAWNFRELTSGADISFLRYATPFQRHFKWAFGLCGTLALACLFLNLGNRNFYVGYRHFLILSAAVWIAQIIFVTSGRYRAAMIPSILLLAGSAVSYILSNFKSYPKIFLSLAVAAVLVFVPSPPINEAREKAEAETILGEAMMKSGQLYEAEKLLRSASENMSRWSRSYNLLGIVLERQNRIKEAEDYYFQATECDKENPDGWMNLASLYSSLNRRDKAQEYFDKAFKLNKESPELDYNYALFLYRWGDNAGAEKHYRACLNINPSHRMALNNLGIVCLMRNRNTEALEYFSKALRLEPGNAQLMKNLAIAYFSLGNTSKATKLFNKARKADLLNTQR